eukprot:6459904-Amphidinium_carterae.4
MRLVPSTWDAPRDDAARRRRVTWRFVSCNVTSWGTLKKQWQFWRSLESMPDVVAVQEHHRARARQVEDKAWMRARAAAWLPTFSSESGGVGVLHKPHLLAKVVWEHPTGRATAVLMDTLIPHGLLVICVYLRTGKAFVEQADIIADIVEYVKSDGRCFMLFADWQCTPSDVRSSDLLSTLRAELVAPATHTCSSGEGR